MANEEKDLRAKFLRIFANMPEKLREDILIVIEKKPYTWSSAYLEIKDDSEIGQKILKTLKKIHIL